MSAVYHLRTGVNLVKDHLPYVEKCFNWAGYIPPVVHRVSGGTRMVFGVAEMVSSVALSILIYNYGAAVNDRQLQDEGWKLLDFAVHGAANVIRGFVEAHRFYHFIFPIYDYFVPENACLSYSRPIFRG